MRTSFAVAALCLLVFSSGVGASTASFNFGTTGGEGYSLSTAGVLSFDNLRITGSTHANDLLSYVVTIGNLTIDKTSQVTVTPFPGFSIVSYSFVGGGTAPIKIFDPTGATEYFSGTLHVSSLVIINGTAVNLDSGANYTDITNIVAENGTTAATILDMAATQQGDFTLTLSVAAPINFDTIIQGSTAGSGAAQGSAGTVPEPATLALLGLGLTALVVRRRK